MPLHAISDAASKTGAKLYRNQLILEKAVQTIGTSSTTPPPDELEVVEQIEGADAVLYDNQVVLLEAIHGVIQGELPPETTLKRHALEGPSAAANNQAIMYANIRALALPAASPACHSPLQIKYGQTSYAYLTGNQKELLSLVRSKDTTSTKFVVVQQDKERGCQCALL